MLTLAINSAMPQTAVALLSMGKSPQLLGEKSWQSARNESAKILPALEALLQKNKKSWSDLQAIFVVIGPGPFTGLRVGVTIANVIAWSTNSKIFTAKLAELQPQKTFGENALKLFKNRKATKLAKPLYLRKPHITKSKSKKTNSK